MAITHAMPLLYPVVAGDALMLRAMHDFDELPALRLTTAQAMRLWDRDRPTCQKVLEKLVEVHFLLRDADGRYCRPPAERCSRRNYPPCETASNSQ